jgi:hypothetical protein
MRAYRARCRRIRDAPSSSHHPPCQDS